MISPDPKDSHVLLHAAGDGGSLKAVLSAALDILVVVDKQRDILCADNVKLHVDEVADLGSFVEVEAIDRDGSSARDKLHGQSDWWLEALAIDPGQFITGSYSDLMLARARR